MATLHERAYGHEPASSELRNLEARHKTAAKIIRALVAKLDTCQGCLIESDPALDRAAMKYVAWVEVGCPGRVHEEA